MNTYIQDVGLICALGSKRQQIMDAIFTGKRSLSWCTDLSPNQAFMVAAIDQPLSQLEDKWSDYNCRNNQLLMTVAEQIMPTLLKIKETVAANRIGLILGTSTSGVAAGEAAVKTLLETGKAPANYHYKQQSIAGGSDFLSAYLGIEGPCFTISTACSSSSNALASAKKLLQQNLCDVVIAGGADSLCQLTVQGFSALSSVAKAECNPFMANRDGINIGEAAALFVLSRDPASIRLAGAGSSSDAHHISAPDPSGAGAKRAMQAALDDAGLKAEKVDYINMHGTATPKNDAMESLAVYELFSDHVPVSSTKGMVGHTLGAAGALEAAFCYLQLNHMDYQNRLIPNVADGEIDPDLPAIQLISKDLVAPRKVQIALSNSFAFGGNNACVILEAT